MHDWLELVLTKPCLGGKYALDGGGRKYALEGGGGGQIPWREGRGRHALDGERRGDGGGGRNTFCASHIFPLCLLHPLPLFHSVSRNTAGIKA